MKVIIKAESDNYNQFVIIGTAISFVGIILYIYNMALSFGKKKGD
jgi:hypothetical protein